MIRDFERKMLIFQYEARRSWIIARAKEDLENQDKALVFAYKERIYPVYHHSLEREIFGVDVLEDVFPRNRSRDFLNEVIAYVDSRWMAKEYTELQFNLIENKFGGHKANRLEIADVLRYAYLHHRFDVQFYASVKHRCPAEAQDVDKDLELSELEFE